MLAHSRRERTSTTERVLGRMMEKLNIPSSRRKEEIRIKSLRRALLAVNIENRIRFALGVAQRDIGLVYAAHLSTLLNCIKTLQGRDVSRAGTQVLPRLYTCL
jgi:hypothetical protein